MDNLVNFYPRNCMLCGKGHEQPLRLDADKIREWELGAHVQHVFPELSPDERELMITGTHAECWENAFGDEDE